MSNRYTLHKLAINEWNDWEAFVMYSEGVGTLLDDEEGLRDIYEILKGYFERGEIDPEPAELEDIESHWKDTFAAVRIAREGFRAPEDRTNDQIANTLRAAARAGRIKGAHQSNDGQDWWFPQRALEEYLSTLRWRDVKPVEPELESAKLQPSEYEITDGYVGGFGVTYKTATDETLTEAITAAAQRNNKPEDEIMQLLASGKSVAWCDSPNHYYDHGTGIIRRKRNAPPVQLVKCACGHSVPAAQVMSASMGASCMDCYDRMSD